MKKIELKKTLFLSFLILLGIIALSGWAASLVIPDWDFYKNEPFWLSVHAWILFGIIAFFSIIFSYIVVDLAIDKEILEKEKKKLDAKVAMLEKELERVKHG